MHVAFQCLSLSVVMCLLPWITNLLLYVFLENYKRNCCYVIYTSIKEIKLTQLWWGFKNRTLTAVYTLNYLILGIQSKSMVMHVNVVFKALYCIILVRAEWLANGSSPLLKIFFNTFQRKFQLMHIYANIVLSTLIMKFRTSGSGIKALLWGQKSIN